MGIRGRFAGVSLVHLLLLVTVAELALNRLAVPTLRPPGDVTPPGWHQALDHLGLFLLYFASILAVGVLGRRLWALLGEDSTYWRPLRYALVAAGVVFLALASAAILVRPGEGASFAFETSFVAVLAVLVAIQVTTRGDLGAKVGLLLLITPLVVHYYGPFAIRYIDGPEALWGDLPERVVSYGHWSMVMAALASPYCFAPRPFLLSAARLGPVVVALFVAVLGTVILRQHYEVGMMLASRGLGIDLGPGAPSSFLALNLMALATVTWTLTSCFTADSPSRREIGVGLGLVVLAGYGFSWPLQYLVGAVGLLQISDAAQYVGAEERAGSTGRRSFRAPPIADEVWQSYVGALVRALRGPAARDEGEAAMQAVTSAGEDRMAVTHLVGRRRGVELEVRIERAERSIVAIEVQCGAAPPAQTEPAWTLYARPERLLGMGAHPEPPATGARPVKTEDEPFDQRFRVRDAGAYSERLLDEGLRARATAFIDGWLAFWPGRGLRYRVHPGHGAPLDHPIPITELAFRGQVGEAACERLITLLELLVDVTSRGLASRES